MISEIVSFEIVQPVDVWCFLMIGITYVLDMRIISEAY